MSSPYCQPCDEKIHGHRRHNERCRVPSCANYAKSNRRRRRARGMKGIVGWGPR